MHICMCIGMYTHVCVNNERERANGHEFEGMGQHMGEVGGRKVKGKNNVIILSFQQLKIK